MPFRIKYTIEGTAIDVIAPLSKIVFIIVGFTFVFIKFGFPVDLIQLYHFFT